MAEDIDLENAIFGTSEAHDLDLWLGWSQTGAHIQLRSTHTAN